MPSTAAPPRPPPPPQQNLSNTAWALATLSCSSPAFMQALLEASQPLLPLFKPQVGRQAGRVVGIDGKCRQAGWWVVGIGGKCRQEQERRCTHLGSRD